MLICINFYLSLVVFIIVLVVVVVVVFIWYMMCCLVKSEVIVVYIVYYDVLLGFLNWLYFYYLFDKMLYDGLENGIGIVVVYIDLDYFKDINDIFGYFVGDKVIVVVV